MQNSCPRCKARTTFRSRLALAMGQPRACPGCASPLELRPWHALIVETLAFMLVVGPVVALVVAGYAPIAYVAVASILALPVVGVALPLLSGNAVPAPTSKRRSQWQLLLLFIATVIVVGLWR